MRVFIEHGDRTNRNKARLKYVLDAWGFEKFLAAVEEKLGAQARRACRPRPSQPRPAFDRAAHIGVHAQKQAGLNWIGVVLAGRQDHRARRCAGSPKIARDLGDGDIRLTVWQNLLISGVPDDKVALAEAAIAALGLDDQGDLDPRRARRLHRQRPAAASPPRTPRSRPRRSPRWCEARVALDTPVNIHLTGCHHSCAQHYIGDIGLIARARRRSTRTATRSRAITSMSAAASARTRALGARNLSRREGRGRAAHGRAHAEGLSRARASADETFLAFTRRHEVEALKAMFDAEAVE